MRHRTNGLSRRIAVAALLGGLAQSCGDAGPQPGRLTLQLVAPNDDLGAVRVRLIGAGLNDPSAFADHRLFFRISADSALDAVVVGDLANGYLFSVWVPDVDGAYNASIIEVATGANQLVPSLNGFALRVIRP